MHLLRIALAFLAGICLFWSGYFYHLNMLPNAVYALFAAFFLRQEYWMAGLLEEEEHDCDTTQ